MDRKRIEGAKSKLDKSYTGVIDKPSFINGDGVDRAWPVMIPSQALSYLTEEEFLELAPKALLDQDKYALRSLIEFYRFYCIPDERYVFYNIILAFVGEKEDVDLAVRCLQQIENEKNFEWLKDDRRGPKAILRLKSLLKNLDTDTINKPDE